MPEDLWERLDVRRLITQAVAFIPDLVAALLILLLFWIGYRVLRVPTRAMLRRWGLHEALINMLVDNLLNYSLAVIAIVMAAGQVGINVTAALGAIGVVGIALGFAAQDTLSNVIAGFLIFIDRPFRVGDWVTVAEQSGKVSEITMRTTRLRTLNNTWIIIPNKAIIDEVMINHSKRGATRILTPIGIAYKEHIPQAREVILQAISGLDNILREPPPDVVVDSLGASSVDLLVRVWVDDASLEQPVRHAVVEASKLALDEAGIEIPFPHLQLFFEDVRDPVWEKATEFRRSFETPPAA